MDEEIPAACLLTDKQLQARRRDYLDKAAAKLTEFTEIPGGFNFVFPLETPILQELANIIDLERQCCPFLNFKMNLETGKKFVSLELTGAEGAKEMIKSLFDWN